MLSSTEILHTMLEDNCSLTNSERTWVERFNNEIQSQLNSSSCDETTISMFAIADRISLDLTIIAKEGPFMVALWVVLLAILREQVPIDKLKYPDLQSFLEESPYIRFTHETDVEQHRLWHTANWMYVLFQMIPAKKNKGLAIQVIPKLVEGWHAKYVTGSGQTRLTGNRVHIFETEGNVKATHRGKLKPKKRTTTAQPMFKRQSSVKRGRKRSIATSVITTPGSKITTLDSSSYNGIDQDFELFQPEHKRSRSSYQRSTISGSSRPGSTVSSTFSDTQTVCSEYTSSRYLTMVDECSNLVSDSNKALEEVEQQIDPKHLNLEMKEAFKLLRDQSCSKLPTYFNPRGETLGTTELLRSCSTLISGPSTLGRGVSWTEIPVSSLNMNTLTSMAPPSAPFTQSQPLLLLQAQPQQVQVPQFDNLASNDDQLMQDLFQGYSITSPPPVL